MMDKCPECKENIDILPIQMVLDQSSGIGGVAFTQVTGTSLNSNHTSNTYKCPNTKCWVTKITESWE